MKPKLIRITTVSSSLKILLKGQLGYMNQFYDVVGISSDGNDLKEVEINEGIKTIPVSMTRTIAPLKDIISVWKIYKILKKEQPDIVHTHTPKAGIVGMLAARLAKVRIRLHTVAGLPLLEAKGLKRIVLNYVEKATYKFATRVYPNSQGLQDIILDNRFCKKEKLKVIANGSSNGINCAHFNPSTISQDQRESLKRELNIDATNYVFIFIGRLVGDKGINELVAAFQNIEESFSNCKLLLVGAAEPKLDPLKPNTITTLKSNKNIIEVGFQNDVRPYFSISDSLVFPTYREGFPNVVMQAGAMGLPAIVTNINGCNEIIIEGKNGTIIEPKDDISLYNAMKKFILEKEQWQKPEFYRKSIVERFDQEIVWKALFEEYKLQETNVR